MFIRAAQRNWKFYDSGPMMGEVIMKWFYFYYFWFTQPYVPTMPKNQNKNIRCVHAQIFFYGAQPQGMPLKLYIFFPRIFLLSQNMEKYVNS